jgi:clan AA aspartic protease
MEVWLGKIGEDGRPRLPLKIRGGVNQLDFEAVVDTGFTGFLYMPILASIPLGVLLESTSRVTLADGSEITVLLAQFEVEVMGDKLTGWAMLDMDGGNDVLIGMEFMRNFSRVLHVDGLQNVLLIDRVAYQEQNKKFVDSKAK